MAWEGVPWFVDGGDHSPEVARVLAYAASGSREGIIGPTDLKVTASAIPDGNVHIAPGAASVLNQFAADGAQAYIARNAGDEVVALDPQGSSGNRYDLVCLVVQDPQYAGQPEPPSVPNGPYVVSKVYKGVAANTRLLSEVDADQAGLALARVKFSANDGTVTNSEITDLRNTLFARSENVERIVSLPEGTAPTEAPEAGLAVFPAGASWAIDVPDWATRLNLSAVLSGFNAKDTGSDGGTANGTMVVALGAVVTDTARWKTNAIGPGRNTTITIQAAEGDMDCRSIAGTNQLLEVRLVRSGGGNMDMQSIDGTTCVVRATFLEKAV